MDYLGKGEILTNRDVNKFEINQLFVRMEHFWDLLFQLMKHGINTLHVGFIFCSVYVNVIIWQQLPHTIITAKSLIL